ncbi:transposase [Candidatus Parcubacteria bacterium]|nr:transposase [Candidatus Parcubacteria bacterium]
MERKVPFLEGEYYHLYNRGVEKRTIFSSSSDYKRFTMLLYLANSDSDVRLDNILKSHKYEEVFSYDRGNALVAIGAFCLMPNHFHLLVTPLKPQGLSKFMLKLQTGYSMYFNTRYERSGSLFQGPFKSEHVENDRYLKYLYSYIHLNPAKLKVPHWQSHSTTKKSTIEFVETYPYSSYREYLSKAPIITDPVPFPKYFNSTKEIRAHITDWMVEYEK